MRSRSGRIGVQHVRGADEHHLAEVGKQHGQVVVAEGVVLLRIEHLEQRRGRIAVEAGAELVQLVEHEHRIARARLADPLDDVAGQRADVGAPVAADLGLVVHAARLVRTNLRPVARAMLWPSEVLPTPGGPTNTGSGSCLGIELAHRQILEDAPLDLGQAVVVLVQDAPRLGNVDGVLARLRPGQLDQPVQIGAHHRVLSRGLGQLSRRLNSLRACCSASSGMPASAIAFSSSWISAAVPSVSPSSSGSPSAARAGCTRAGDPRPRLWSAGRCRADLQHLDAVLEQLQDLVEPGAQIERLQDLLLLLGAQIHEARHQVGGLQGALAACTALISSGGVFSARHRASSARSFSPNRRPSISGVTVSGSSMRSMRAARNG